MVFSLIHPTDHHSFLNLFMKKIFTFLFLTAFFLVSCNSNQTAKKELQSGYMPVSDSLFREIFVQDSLMFAAFNQHNTKELMRFFAAELEFFHDKGGLTNFTQTADAFNKLFANNKKTGLRRDLIPGSMEVYPIANYGAVSTNRHLFCHQENGKDDCGSFKNIMIWKKTAEGWKVTRVISYDH